MIPDESLVDRIPVRTPTLPPATHTNVWCLGDASLTIVDPASPYEDQRALLFDALQERIAAGATVERIVLTHHHIDHVSGADDLRERLASIGQTVSVLAHEATEPLVEFEVDDYLADGDILDAGRAWVVRHTPGHAPGHLALHQPDTGVVVAGDLVAGNSTIILDPKEGSLAEYLDSLESARRWSPSVLLPAHGDPLPPSILDEYITHRHARTDQVRQALASHPGAAPIELVPAIYPELPVAMHGFAAVQVQSHLIWLRDRGEAGVDDGRWSSIQ